MTTETITIKSEGLTLARVIWQFLKRQPNGYVEKVLAANPGLAALGPFLPIGTAVLLPIESIPSARAERKVTRLWD